MRRSNDRTPIRSDQRRRAVERALVLIAVLLVTAASSASAAPFAFSATSSDGSSLSAPNVGSNFTMHIGLDGLTSTPAGPYTLELEWGQSDPGPFSIPLGALILNELPSLTDLSAGLDASECSAALGVTGGGNCLVDLTIPEVTPPGPRALVDVPLLYTWVVPDGFETCTIGEPGCLQAGQMTYFLAWEIEGDGTRVPFASLELSTLGRPGLRPIPEPGTALLLGLGLASLGARRRGPVDQGSSRGGRPGAALWGLRLRRANEAR